MLKFLSFNQTKGLPLLIGGEMRFFVSSAVKNLIAALSSFFLLMPAFKAVSYAAYSSGNYSNSYAVLDTKESEVSLSDFGDEWYKENKVAMEEIAYHGYRFINPDVQSIKTILKAYFPNRQDYGNALAQYHAAVSQNNAKGIKGIMGWQIWDVCKAGGLDISSADGKNKCRTVAIALGRHYTPVCDKGSRNCVKNFKKINTQMRQGVYIAKAYAKSERNDTIACFKTAVPCVNSRSAGVAELSAAGSCLFCYSVYDPLVNLYEFSFSALSESNDAVTATDIRAAMCALVGLDFEINIIAAGVGADSNLASFAPGPMRCLTKDSSLCAKVDNFAKEFGFNATYSAQYQGCVFSSNSVHSSSEIINEYSGIIDNYVFSSGNAQTQIQASPSLDDSIRAYCENKLAPTPVTSFDCDKSHKRWIRGTYEDNEDILTCHINGKRVDFVFDDLTQTRAFWGETLIKGSIQGMGCIVNGGTFSGERCIGLGEKQCMLLREANLQECPECKAVYWEDETQSCVLPSSASASDLKKGINITLIVAGAVVGVVLTVATAGSATAVVLTGIETAGAAIEVTSQLKIDAIADDFLVKSNRCKDAACAKELIKENLKRLANFYNDMTATEVSAVDSELARLANLIPDDDEIWATRLMNGPGIADNQLGFFDADSWEPEQVWRAVGITLQLTSVVSSITSFLVKKSSNALTKSTAAIKQKFARAIQSIDNAPESTLRAKRLELKQLVKNGKKVADNADGTIVIPKTQMAAPKDPLLEAHDAAVIDEQFSKIERNIFKGQEGKNIDKIAVLQDLVDVERSNLTATQYRAAMIETISEDTELYRYMEDFEKLTDAQKTDFAKKVVSKINTKLGDGTPTGQVFAVSFDGQYPRAVRGNTYNGDIYINTDGKGSNLLTGRMVDNKTAEGFLSSLSHEHAHGIDDLNPGTGALSEKVVKESAELYDDAHYLENPLEIMAHSREDWVADGNLVNDIRTRHTEIVNSSKQSTHTSPQHASIRRIASTTTNTSSALQSAKNKLYTYGTDFDKVVDDFLRNDGGYPAWWKMSDLTPAEHNALQSFLNEKGITLTTETQELNGIKETFYRLKKY